MFYAELGFRHILDIEGYDHMLFLLALTMPLTFREWKQVLWWVTAFTIGHSLTLAFTATALLKVDSSWVELGIAITIFLTGVFHLIRNFSVSNSGRYLSLIFGAVHGMGFGSYYSFIAQNDVFWWAWLPFNLGIEVGQLALVIALLFVYSIFQKLGIKIKTLRILLTGVVLTLSAQMILERIPNELF
jgi:hydrogenase/urease accessory protein HupE